MATLDLGSVVGPQGPQGVQGPQGPRGEKGEKGDVGSYTFDTAPTAGSTNPVTSGGVKTALDGKADLSGGKVPEQQLPALGANLYTYTFTASDWSSGTLTIPASTHGFTGSSIIFQFWHLISGSYTYGTWAGRESWAEIDPSTHVITLYGPTEGYGGKVVILG